eukprot:scaffold247808_cov35-Tisochrysis_lutea.AAC.1
MFDKGDVPHEGLGAPTFGMIPPPQTAHQPLLTKSKMGEYANGRSVVESTPRRETFTQFRLSVA